MAVNDVHLDYAAQSASWLMIRDVMGGDSVMKLAGERYVPRLECQSQAEYLAYVDRGFFYNATARTVSGFLGMIFRKEPVLRVPEGDNALGKFFKKFLDDVDLCGCGIGSFAREVVQEVATVGRVGTLVDWNEAESRAYCCKYLAEDILNWREERIDGRLQLTLVVLRERRVVPGADGFGSELKEQFRVLRLVPVNGSLVYQVEVWGMDGKALVLVETLVPVRFGRSLCSIPFVFHGASSSRPGIERSPITDIVSANVDHYKMMADFKHGMHFTALPTAWVAGFEKDSILRIGSSAAWVTEQLGATAGFLEFKGEGLRTFERALDRSERLLAVLGARLLESQRRVSESAEALSIRQAGDSSVIAGLAVAISKSLCEVLAWVYWWHDSAKNPNEVPDADALIALNTDFDISRLSGKEIEALVVAWQAGAFSHDTLLYRLAIGEVLPPGRTNEQEFALIKKNPPPPPVQAIDLTKA